MTNEDLTIEGSLKNGSQRIRKPSLVTQKVKFPSSTGTIEKEVLVGQFQNKPYGVAQEKNLSFKDYAELSKEPQFEKLKPYRRAMIQCLKQKGLNFSNKPTAQVANAFYRNIVVPAKGVYADAGVDLDNYYFDNFNSTTLDSILGGVTGYVKNVAAKEQELGSQGLTKFEKFVAGQFNQVKSKATETGKDEAARSVGQKILFGWGKWAILGMVGLLLYFVIKKR